MLYRSTDRLCRCGAPMKNLAHSASFESLDKNAPSNAGTKHLVANAKGMALVGAKKGKTAAGRLWTEVTPALFRWNAGNRRRLRRYWELAPLVARCRRRMLTRPGGRGHCLIADRDLTFARRTRQDAA
jgi:hypothetical protein